MQRFQLNDIIIILFHKIFNRLIPEELPSYLRLFGGHTRLRSSHLYRLCFVSSIRPQDKLFTSLPLDNRDNMFKWKLKQYFRNL